MNLRIANEENRGAGGSFPEKKKRRRGREGDRGTAVQFPRGPRVPLQSPRAPPHRPEARRAGAPEGPGLRPAGGRDQRGSAAARPLAGGDRSVKMKRAFENAFLKLKKTDIESQMIFA